MTGLGIEGYFSCSRGVRQGDPLSPILFGIAEDFFGRYLTDLVHRGRLAPMRYTRDKLFPSHLFYGDVMIIFMSARMTNFRELDKALSLWLIIWAISELAETDSYFGKSISLNKWTSLANISGI